MRTKTFDLKENACQYVAEYLAKRINEFVPSAEKPHFVLGLPTGSSPEPVYHHLVQLYNNNKVSFKNVVTFNMDEYVGLGPDSDQSYHYFMHHHLFDHVDIPRDQIHILNGLAADVDAECAAYEALIAKLGPIDVFLGGIGPNGHIAFNEVGSTIDSRTRKIQLEESTIVANSRFFQNKSDVPRYALSVGIATVLAARQVIILAFGGAKAHAVKVSLLDKVSSDCPGTFMRSHANVEFIMDEASAAEYQNSHHSRI